MSGLESQTQRSYSPVFRSRKLADDDGDDVYAERIAEMAVEMDLALDYMKDVGTFLKEREDINILTECN